MSSNIHRTLTACNTEEIHTVRTSSISSTRHLNQQHIYTRRQCMFTSNQLKTTTHRCSYHQK